MERKKHFRWFRILTGILLASFLYRIAAADSALVNERADVVTILPGGQKLDAAGARELQRQELTAEEPLELNCWGEAGETAVENRETGRRASAALLYAGEKTGLIIPGTEILSWNENGCFLDRETAVRLFGSEQARGQTVWCGDREYTVCGTFESFRNSILCRAREEDGAVLTTISCRVPTLSGAASRTQEFMMRRNLTGEFTDFTFLAYLCHDLLLLFPVCLGMRLLRATAETKRQFRFLWLLQLSLAAGLLLFLWKNFRIPSDMIPSRWSDFSFWGTWWETQRENLLRMLRTAQGEAQTMLLWNFCRSVCADAGAVICVLLFVY